MRASMIVGIAFVLLSSVALSSAQAILAASYIPPYDSGWDKIIAAGPSMVPIALVNPGPISSGTDPWVQTYAALVKRVQAVGIKVFGYVDTSYTAVPVNTAITNANNFFNWMGVNGIFLDQASNNCGVTSYYSQLYTAIHNRGGQVILNPGTATNECYMAVGDIILSAETDWNTYSSTSFYTPSWVYKYPATRFYHIAHTLPSTAMNAAVQLAKQRNAGYVYFTEVPMPNPYSPFTTLWTSLMNAILAARPATTSAPAPAPPSPAATTAAPVRAAINTRALGVASLNPLPTTAGPVFQTMQVSLSANSQYLYINFTSYNTFNLNGAPSSAWPRVNFYLDLDNNPATGFQVNNGGTVGSEMLVQGQGMYKQMTGNFNAGSIGTALATGTTNTNSVGIAIPVSTLKAQYAAASTVRVVGHNDQTGQFMPPPTSFLTCTVA